MHVLMIGPFAWAPKGTVSSRAFLMGRALVRRGHKVTILMPPYDNPCHSGYECERDGVDLINMVLPSWGDSPKARLTVPLAMLQRVRIAKPDLVHVFKPVGYAGLTGLYTCLSMPRLPLVLDSDDWEGRGGWADANPYPLHWRMFFTWQENWLARSVDMVTVASRTLQNKHIKAGVWPDRVVYLPNGPNPLYKEWRHVPASKIQALRQALGVADQPLAVYIGHISYASEVSLVLEALPEVLRFIPELRVVVVGSGPGVPALQETAHSAGIERRLVFTGWVDQVNAPLYLAAAQVALYPYRDTLVNRAKSPSKITSYMAMGKPIVASDVGEVSAYLENGRSGVLVPPDDPRAFASALVDLLSNPDRAAELGRRAEERIWQQYDWDRQVAELELVYIQAVQHAAETD
jgi:glycosyltransferase involved in cell wall biosynthesis